MEGIKAWHFLPDDGKTQHRNRRQVAVGRTYSCRGAIELCENGMHGSRRIIDALQYAPGSIVCEVEIWTGVKEQRDKLVGRHRKVLRMVDATNILHRFACECAKQALTVGGVKDRRCWDAIDVKLRWIEGNATDEELATARAAAWATARDAAWATAWATARAAAWAAAWDTARAAAWAAAWDAAWDVQNDLLTKMVTDSFNEE